MTDGVGRAQGTVCALHQCMPRQVHYSSLAAAVFAVGCSNVHCHILEHAERGMMGMLDVAP